MTEPDCPSASVVARARSGAGALLTAAVLVNAAVLVVGTTVAAFTGKDAVSQPSSAGSVSITLDASGRTSVAAGVSGLGAGDWFERVITVSAGDGLPIGAWTLTTTASPSSLLDRTADKGLQLAVHRCDSAWRENAVTPVQDYVCDGTQTVALPEDDIIMNAQTLATLQPVTNHLRLTVRLADAATDDMQSLTSTITYTFAGVQRAGVAR